jgi:hypothetical protein
MKFTKLNLTFLTFSAAMLLTAGMLVRSAAQTAPSDQESSTSSDDSTQVRIARAMSAGPDNVSKSARVIDTDARGDRVR